MFNWIKAIFRWFKEKMGGRELSDYLTETRTIKVEGIRFKIRRLNIFDHLDGSKILTTYYQLYQSGKLKEAEANLKKVREHFKDCFMSVVVEPKLKRTDDPDDSAIFVDELTSDLKLANLLYVAIMAFTDNKKKV